MKIGLFFGSFNPIHIGHLIIANHIVNHSDLNKVWFVVSPQNPFKEKKSLLNNNFRLEMVEIATRKYDYFEASNIEFNLPQPSYTVNTLEYLMEKHPDKEFSLIMGQDNLASLHRWKNYMVILQRYDIYVYPRLGQEVENGLEKHPRVKKIDAPIIELSATMIREEIAQKKNVMPMLDCDVWKYIDKNGFYM